MNSLFRHRDDSLAMAWDISLPSPLRKARTEDSTALGIAKEVASQIVSVFSGEDYDDDASSGFGGRSDYRSGDDTSHDSRSYRSSRSFARRLRESGAKSPELIAPPRMSQVEHDELRRVGSDGSSVRLTRTFSGAMEEEKKDDDLSQSPSVKPDPVKGPEGDDLVTEPEVSK